MKKPLSERATVILVKPSVYICSKWPPLHVERLTLQAFTRLFRADRRRPVAPSPRCDGSDFSQHEGWTRACMLQRLYSDERVKKEVAISFSGLWSKSCWMIWVEGKIIMVCRWYWQHADLNERLDRIQRLLPKHSEGLGGCLALLCRRLERRWLTNWPADLSKFEYLSSRLWWTIAQHVSQYHPLVRKGIDPIHIQIQEKRMCHGKRCSLVLLVVPKSDFRQSECEATQKLQWFWGASLACSWHDFLVAFSWRLPICGHPHICPTPWRALRLLPLCSANINFWQKILLILAKRSYWLWHSCLSL